MVSNNNHNVDTELKMNMNGVDPETPDALVQQSLKQYGQILELLRSLSQYLEAHNTENIQQFNRTFSILHCEAQSIDQKLMERLQETSIPPSINTYLSRRKELQENILQLLKETLPKANGVKTLLASEMVSIKNGRRAMSGYNNSIVTHGRIVNKRS